MQTCVALCVGQLCYVYRTMCKNIIYTLFYAHHADSGIAYDIVSQFLYYACECY